jgi:hypothetical protein
MRLRLQKPRQEELVLPCRLPLRRPAPWGLSTGNENVAVGAAVSQNNPMAREALANRQLISPKDT